MNNMNIRKFVDDEHVNFNGASTLNFNFIFALTLSIDFLLTILKMEKFYVFVL